MKFNTKTLLVLLLCIILLASIVTVVSLQPPAETVTEPKYTPEIDKAVEFFEETYEPYALLFLDVIYRRFGVEEFVDSLERYDTQMVGSPVLRVFRRIADYDNQLQPGDLQALSYELDFLTAPALYCDREPLPNDYVSTLENSMNTGGYLLTHTLLAWIYMEDNGCELVLPEGFVEEMLQANSDLINLGSTVTDLELEAAAFLYLADQGELVDDAFVDCVINAQDEDGGWTTTAEKWHATVLGLLILLHAEYPSDSYPPMLATE